MNSKITMEKLELRFRTNRIIRYEYIGIINCYSYDGFNQNDGYS